MADLFERDAKTIRKHVNNIFKEGELEKESNTQFLRVAQLDKKVLFYSLDVIIGIGYRVKSQKGILFRNILKDYLLKGYVMNDRHFQDIDYITHVLQEYKNAGGNLPSGETMLEFLSAYQRGFKILDDYDHHTLSYPKGHEDIYYLISRMY